LGFGISNNNIDQTVGQTVPPNLELEINGEYWKVVVLKDNNPEPYYAPDLANKTLYIHNEDVDRAKFATWKNYHN
jgi:hypothetical protein